ncbi:Fimbrial assembly protein (PilN) [compost metagenome]|jgi:type IV pilus assembly protein PilN|uniref:Tfp pilus assembly protein PilN n=2 Tax=Cupriavidus necator TaxID=106590 RepID=G0EYN7_CUPNN|nr:MULTISPECIES: PilN domain-containing protein [Cupriavidus]AEI78683.1 Tfp pilus assembly protein PilN [Cupriavidus necator N-1]KAI3605134.1 Type IV pilus biogenesis protein PilN [Cupriavidus necator H850]MDX6012793.1 PilN domain-containing protein [Cupriavidus necator]QQX84129.1 PilN domain-containing protein [Cupriavidus necator]QUN28128.1 PilN domain-containing protein [Cupriavidus sp. KK10]
MSTNTLPSVNLLPYHEARKAARRKKVYTMLAGAAVAGAAVVLLGGYYIDGRIASVVALNQVLSAENAKLDGQIREVNSLKKDIDALLQRQKAVESLQTERNRPVQLLEELVRQVPEGVYLTSLKQTGEAFTIAGVAQSNERISELLRNLSGVAWLDKAELVESKAVTMTNNLREQRRLFEFSMRFTYRAPEAAADGKKAVPGASAPAAAPVPAPAAGKA